MRVVKLEVLSEEAATDLRRLAKLERRRERERSLAMTSADVIKLFWQDLSELRANIALSRNTTTVESPLPPVAEDRIGRYENPEAIGLLEYARGRAGQSLLVEFSAEPSKTFEEGLRAAAKKGTLRVHFYRLVREWVLLKVHPQETVEEWDKKFLHSLGVRS